jgi:hypothetical protein
MAQQVLKHIVHVQDGRSTSTRFKRRWRNGSEVKQSALKERATPARCVYPRQVAMYLVKERRTPRSEIGRAFGGKHHTTVIHSIHKIDNRVTPTRISTGSFGANGSIAMRLRGFSTFAISGDSGRLWITTSGRISRFHDLFPAKANGGKWFEFSII